MKDKADTTILRKILQTIILLVNGALLCVLFIPFCVLLVAIGIIWLLTDYLLMKLERS